MRKSYKLTFIFQKYKILSCESIQEMSQILLMLNEKFSSCESLSKIISSVVVEKPKEEAKGYNEDDDEKEGKGINKGGGRGLGESQVGGKLQGGGKGEPAAAYP